MGDRLRPLSKRSIATIFPKPELEPVPKKLFIFITLSPIRRDFHKMPNIGQIAGLPVFAPKRLTRVNTILEEFFNDWLTSRDEMANKQGLAPAWRMALGAASGQLGKGQA